MVFNPLKKSHPMGPRKIRTKIRGAPDPADETGILRKRLGELEVCRWKVGPTTTFGCHFFLGVENPVVLLTRYSQKTGRMSPEIQWLVQMCGSDNGVLLTPFIGSTVVSCRGCNYILYFREVMLPTSNLLARTRILTSYLRFLTVVGGGPGKPWNIWVSFYEYALEN